MTAARRDRLEKLANRQYPGGKGCEALLSWILEHLPTHRVYVEPFIGGGAILRRKTPALQSVILDTDIDVVSHWRRVAMPGVHVVEGSGIDWLDEHAVGCDQDTLIYCDPPYLMSERCGKRLYEDELSPEDHERLLKAITATPACVLISGYPSQLYQDYLAEWSRDDRQVRPRWSQTPKTERLWWNFDLSSVTLHEQYCGRDWPERWKVRKSCRTRARSFLKLPRWRQKYLLDYLAEALRTGQVPEFGRTSSDLADSPESAGGPASPNGSSGDGQRRLF